LENKFTGCEAQAACRQDELIGGKVFLLLLLLLLFVGWD
jgi:hypothetical protein